MFNKKIKKYKNIKYSNLPTQEEIEDIFRKENDYPLKNKSYTFVLKENKRKT